MILGEGAAGHLWPDDMGLVSCELEVGQEGQGVPSPWCCLEQGL